MANVNTKACVLVRDGFTCRYCRKRLYLGPAIKLLDQHINDLDLYDAHGKQEPLKGCWATVDHVVSEAEGGMDTLDNLVASCVVCNSRKGGSTWALPPEHVETAEGWDGLASIFLALSVEYPDQLSSEDRKWVAAIQFQDVQPTLDRLDHHVETLRRLSEANA